MFIKSNQQSHHQFDSSNKERWERNTYHLPEHTHMDSFITLVTARLIQLPGWALVHTLATEARDQAGREREHCPVPGSLTCKRKNKGFTFYYHDGNLSVSLSLLMSFDLKCIMRSKDKTKGIVWTSLTEKFPSPTGTLWLLWQGWASWAQKEGNLLWVHDKQLSFSLLRCRHTRGKRREICEDSFLSSV